MNVTELAQKLCEQGILEEWYSLRPDDFPNKGLYLCEAKTKGIWEIYYCEHGAKINVSPFASEDAACSALLKRLSCRHIESNFPFGL